MATRTRTTWLITVVTVVAVVLIAGLFVVPELVDSNARKKETIARHSQPRDTDEYWTEERIREAEPAGPVAISPVPYGKLLTGVGISIVAGVTIVWLLRRQRRG